MPECGVWRIESFPDPMQQQMPYRGTLAKASPGKSSSLTFDHLTDSNGNLELASVFGRIESEASRSASAPSGQVEGGKGQAYCVPMK